MIATSTAYFLGYSLVPFIFVGASIIFWIISISTRKRRSSYVHNAKFTLNLVGALSICTVLFLISIFDFYHWGYSWLLSTIVLTILLIFQLPAKRSPKFKRLVDSLDDDFQDDVELELFNVGQKSRKQKDIHSLCKNLLEYLWKQFETLLILIKFKIEDYKWWFLAFELVIIVAMFFPSYMPSGICICSQPSETSTRFSRAFQASSCGNGEPCHVYLTHPSNDSIIVVFHSTDGSESTVYFDQVSHANTSTLSDYTSRHTGRKFSISDKVQWEISRNVHWVEIKDLQPGTTYYFRAGYGSNIRNYSPEKKFRTGPSGNEPFVFVTGGDTSVYPGTAAIMKVAASLEPLFVMIGGDLAYTNDFATCYRRWDQWFDMYEENMVTPTGYTIPMITSIGNHEGGGFVQSRGAVPLYFDFFIQDFVPKHKTASSMPAYHSHLFGNETIILSLDSNVATKASDQTDWIRREFAHNVERKRRFAIYHAPMYPSVRDFDLPVIKDIRDNWLDTFDTYNLTLGFENHDHSYKRTKLLKGNQVSTDGSGTIYVGDGCMGLSSRGLHSADRWYEEVVYAKSFVVKVTVGSNVIAEAYDENSNIFDSVAVL